MAHRYSSAVLVGLLVFASGCSGDGTGAERAASPAAPAVGTAAPPAAAPTAAAAVSAPLPGRTVAESGGAAKSDLRGAVSTIESYRGQDPTADPASEAAALAPALPGTVTITRLDTDGYAVSATADDGSTYTIERSGVTFTRSCAPLQPAYCRTGIW